MNMKKMSVNRLVRCAVIAAVYVVVCLALAPFSYGAVQVRVAEALCLLPVFGAEYIIGVTLGCLLANLLGSTVIDVVFGTLATLLPAVLTMKCPNRWLASLPPVVCNMVLVGAVLAYETAGTSAAFWPAYGLNALTVGLGEAVACLVLGVLLVKQLPKIPYFRNRLAS